MSLITREIDKLIEDKISYQDSFLTAQVKFDKKFIGFIGHFPGNPILPGVIIINVMLRMYELYNNKKYSLSQIRQAKFIEPVSADTIVSFFIKSDAQEESIKLTGNVTKKDKIVSKVSLVLRESGDKA
jgi:3-hydroxymyristoyl/3-hydroxydecanoyl-(acyl carrier protein) dehydratase